MSTIVIKGGTMIDGTGKPPVENAVVVVEDDKIAAVGRANEVKVPEGEKVKVIDASGKTVMPGLIDSHVHIYTDGEAGDEFTSMFLKNNPLSLTLRCIPRLKKTLEMGITSLKDGGCGWNWLEVALRDALNRGDIVGPRYFAAGYHLTVTGGHGYFLPPWLANIPIHPEQSTVHVDGPDQWRKMARMNIYNGTDFIKLVASRDVISPGIATAAQATLEELTAAAEEAHKMGKKVMIHAQGPVAIKNAIKAGADIIVHGFFMDEECAEMMVENNVILEGTNWYVRVIAEKGAGRVPDWQLEKAIQTWEFRKKNFKMLMEKGVKMSFGSDAGCPFIRQGYDNFNELRMFVELGMTPMQALVAGTKTAAEAIGIEDKTGTLESGKFADILLIDGDPLKDISILGQEEKIKMVMKEGEIVVTR
ncbi:MAG: amidohydrolase family protein [Dethiobacteria bacterium]|nr:amidohydrolase family protein [Bacillota bacterium]